MRPTRWYDLRHSFGNNLKAVGMNPRTIADLMGNSVKVVLEHYFRTDDSEKRQAINAMPGRAHRPLAMA